MDNQQEERTQSQESRQNKNFLNAILELNQMAYHLKDTEIIHKVLASTVEFTKSEIGYLNYVNEDQKTYQLIAWTEVGSEQSKVESGDYALDQAGIWADCIPDRKPVIYNDLKNIPNKNGYPEGHLKLIRHASVPLNDKDRLRFILSVANKETDYDSMDVLQLYLFGDQLVRILHDKQLENAYIKTRHQYDQLVKNIPIGIFRIRTTLDETLVFENVNQQFCEMLNLSAKEIYKDADNVLTTIHPNDLSELVELIRDVMQTRRPFLWEGRSVIEGETQWLRIEARSEEYHDNEVVWHGVLTDITETKQTENAVRDANTLLENRLLEIEQLQEQLREQTIRDYLTGLFNRRYLDETIERELARAKREGRQLSVVLMDIDHFKSINDTYGHQAGDMVLIELGGLLNQYSRSSDIVCRYGGDEFVIVMPNATIDDAFKRADEWRHVFGEKRFSSNEQRFATTLSIGVASYPLHASSPKGLFQAADQALYQSKIHNNKVSESRRVSTSRLRSIGRSDT